MPGAMLGAMGEKINKGGAQAYDAHYRIMCFKSPHARSYTQDQTACLSQLTVTQTG